jgi:hypothetical protein
MTARRLAPHWRFWLDFWCVGVFVFGVVLAGVVSDATAGPISALLAMLHPDGDNTLTPAFRFGLGLQGALTMGWAVTMFAAFRAAEKLGDAGTATWRLVTIGLLFWYVVDSFISVATGFGLNAVSNTLLVVAYLVPVLASGVLKDR